MRPDPVIWRPSKSRGRRILATGSAALFIGAGLALIPSAPTATAATGGGDLCLYGSDATATTSDAMAAGTNPSIAALSGGGAEVAFQNSGGQLNTYTDTTGATGAIGNGVQAGTSPSIAISSTSGVDIAFNGAGTGDVWAGPPNAAASTGQAISANTSPSVTAPSGGGFVYSFIDSGGGFEVGNASSGWQQPALGGEQGSGTDITSISGGGWDSAFEANNQDAWQFYYQGQYPAYSTGTAMPADGTPAVTGLSTSGEWQMAFANSDEDLYTYNSASQTGVDLGEALAANTNPSITAGKTSNSYVIAYQGSNGDLWIDSSAGGSSDTGHAMTAGSSPSITSTNAGYEVAYQCPAPAAATTTSTQPPSTPIPTPAPTASTKPRIRAKLTIRDVWFKHSRTTRIVKLENIGRLPHDASILVSCRAGIRTDRCPALGRLGRSKRTFDRELAIAAGRSYRHDNVLTITVRARHYTSEIFTVRMPGTSSPTFTARYA